MTANSALTMHALAPHVSKVAISGVRSPDRSTDRDMVTYCPLDFPSRVSASRSGNRFELSSSRERSLTLRAESHVESNVCSDDLQSCESSPRPSSMHGSAQLSTVVDLDQASQYPVRAGASIDRFPINGPHPRERLNPRLAQHGSTRRSGRFNVG